ncbi:hypothetical protein EG329_000957 [Mollisiaceae sp. DMI_Dod_QoI]|nr:hypothetical protein EG329_000957 [Helotiales sp. DMI_Dod_QoI]
MESARNSYDDAQQLATFKRQLAEKYPPNNHQAEIVGQEDSDPRVENIPYDLEEAYQLLAGKIGEALAGHPCDLKYIRRLQRHVAGHWVFKDIYKPHYEHAAVLDVPGAIRHLQEAPSVEDEPTRAEQGHVGNYDRPFNQRREHGLYQVNVTESELRAVRVHYDIIPLRAFANQPQDAYKNVRLTTREFRALMVYRGQHGGTIRKEERGETFMQARDAASAYRELAMAKNIAKKTGRDVQEVLSEITGDEESDGDDEEESDEEEENAGEEESAGEEEGSEWEE